MPASYVTHLRHSTEVDCDHQWNVCGRGPRRTGLEDLPSTATATAVEAGQSGDERWVGSDCSLEIVVSTSVSLKRRGTSIQDGGDRGRPMDRWLGQ